jgi:PTH1 family peptidyl-tRNA hydrolase
MKLVAGLGNPGARYAGTRHNVGFMVLDRLATRVAPGEPFISSPADAIQLRWRQSGDDGVLLVKPLTFMNVSGEAVGALVRYYRVALPDLLVVCDDVNLPLGRLRARAVGSEGGHNGLRSIAQHLGTTEYARLRVGVGRGDDRRDLADHVLARFEPDEQPGIEAAIARAADAVEMWTRDGLVKMMNIFNRAAETDAQT